MPYTSLNGNMFSYLDASGLMALRLAAADREAFIEGYATTLHHAYGIVQKEYVTVRADVLQDTAALVPWLRKSLDYARSLKPKSTKRGA
jgi:hypothetical protein